MNHPHGTLIDALVQQFASGIVCMHELVDIVVHSEKLQGATSCRNSVA